MPSQLLNVPPLSNPKCKPGLRLFPMSGGAYHVFDPATSRHFRMGGEEVRWLQLLDGSLSLEALRAHIPLEYFDAFFGNAARMQLLDGPKQKTAVTIFKIKWPLADPNEFLGRLGLFASLYRVLINRLSFFLLLLNILGLYLLGRTSLMAASNPHFSGWAIPFYILFILLMGFCHEISHSIVAKSLGVNVPVLGFMFFYFHPSFYADVSGIRLLPSPKARVNVLLAGVMANNLLLSASLFLYYLLPLAAGPYLLAFAWINIVVILMNLIPFVEYDGYFVLQELIAEQNFAVRAKQLIRDKAAWRFEYWAHALLSTALSPALLLTAVLGLRRFALRFTHSPLVNYIALFLAFAACLVFFLRTAKAFGFGAGKPQQAAVAAQTRVASGLRELFRSRKIVVSR